MLPYVRQTGLGDGWAFRHVYGYECGGAGQKIGALKYFFEVERDSTLFEGLETSRERDLCEEFMGKFLVIFLTLKGDKLCESQDHAPADNRKRGDAVPVPAGE